MVACSESPCQNAGTCSSDGEGGFLCDCTSDYTGTNCDIGMNNLSLFVILFYMNEYCFPFVQRSFAKRIRVKTAHRVVQMAMVAIFVHAVVVMKALSVNTVSNTNIKKDTNYYIYCCLN